MRKKGLKRIDIEKKIHLLTGLLVGISCLLCFFLCYLFHVNSMKKEYFRSVDQASLAAKNAIYAPDAFIFSERILSDEFLTLRRKAEETGNYELIAKWMEENQYTDFFNYNVSLLNNVKNLFASEDVYVAACEDSGCYIILDPCDGYEYIGMKLQTAPEIETIKENGKLAPTISHSDEGWLCSAFIKLDDPTGKHQVFCGCDADMHVFVNSEIRFVFQMFLFLLIIMTVCSIMGMHFTRKAISAPTRKLSLAARKFADENQTGNITIPLDPEVHTGDELEDINDSLIYLEESILAHKKELELINRAKGRIETELSVAKDIQTGTLPEKFDIDPSGRCNIYALSKPARKVGGDFYNCIRIDDTHIALLIGDVADKGIPAALFMMITQVLLQEHCLRGISPGKVLEKVNSLLLGYNKATMFVTVWLGILDLETGILSASNAGHEYPILRHNSETFQSFKDTHSFVLAGFEGTRYETYEIQLNQDDALFVFTDGVHDAVNKEGKQFTEDALVQVINEADSSSAQSLIQDVLSEIESFSEGAEQFDDITMLAMIFKGGKNA